MHFNEGVGLRMGDCCDPVDHVLLLDRFFFLSYILRQVGSSSSDISVLRAMVFMGPIGTRWVAV